MAAASTGEDEGSEIIVTARRRDESLKDVPISISALGAESIRNRGLGSINEIGSTVPNVRMPPANSGSNGSGAYTYGMRGIATNARNIGFDPGVGAYVDGVYVGRSAAFNQVLADVERVEILRGPQGTLFGKNTIAGAVNIVTRKPSSTPEGSVLVGIGNRNASKIEGRLSGPLTDDVSAKISFSRSLKDGDVINRLDGLDYLHDDNTWSLRGALRAEASPGLSFTLSGDFTKTRSRGMGAQLTRVEGMALTVPGVVANDRDAMSIDGLNRSSLINWRDEHGVALTSELELPGNQVTSITAYRDARLRFSTDDDATPWPIQYSGFDDRTKAFSQELRVASTGTRFWSYLVGFYYFHQNGTSKRYTDAALPDAFHSGPFYPIYNNYPTTYGRISTDSRVNSRVWALFTSNDFKLRDDLTLTIGARYTEERKTLDHRQRDTSWIKFPSLDIVGQSRKDSDFSGNASLNYRPTRDTSIYVSVARGFKSGGFNPDYIRRSVTFAPEKVTSYELGVKSDLFDRKVQLSAAAFYTNYENQQVNIFEAGAFTIKNAGRSTIKGGEVELTLRPVSRLTLTGSAGYTDAKYKAFPNCLGANTDCAGRRLPYVPRWSAFGSAEYAIPVPGGEVRPRVEVGYTGDQYFDATNVERNRVPSYTLANASIAYQRDDGWRVSVWAKNALNKKYDAARWDFASLFGIYYFFPGETRTFGADLSYRF